MNASVNPKTVRAKRIAFLVVAVGFVLAVAVLVWLRSPPSIGTAQSALERMIKDEGEGRLAFVQMKFDKPEYVALLGQKAWVFQFEGEVEAKESCRWTGASQFSPGTFKTVSLPSEVRGGFQMEKASRVNVEGMIVFEKPGMRWKASEHQVRPVRMIYSP
jgi:hypothetical protein